MGITFTRILPAFAQTAETGTQTCIDKSTHGTQTTTTFTEKLTNFDTVNLGSAESFDQACNICDLYTEKEAVGFCCVCDQYMCLQCCKHHEKITLSQNHTIVGKEYFGKLTAETSLFGMRLVPLIKGVLPKYMHGDAGCTSWVCYHYGVFLAPFFIYNANDIFYLNYPGTSPLSSNTLELGTLKKNGDYKKVKRTARDIETGNTSRHYFVQSGSKDIWLMKYSDGTVFYKRIFSTSGVCFGVVPFDNGLAICLYIETGFSLPDWQIQYVDFGGSVKKQIYYDSAGKSLFKSPNHLASNCTEDILFVSDMKENSVIALDPNGNVIYKFTHSSIQPPTGLTCDEENNVYAACKNKVIQIDKHGKKCRVLLDAKAKDIIDICYDKQGKRLAVIEASKAVTVFAFLP